MNRFPKAFEQFTRDVRVEDISTLRQLESEFAFWAGRHWVGSSLQRTALAHEARKLGFQTTFGFSRTYATFQSWSSKHVVTNAYRRRIASYMRTHPHATLREARGHRKK